MKDQFDTQPDGPEEPIKKDRSLLYMGVGLGLVILIMGYLTFFVDDVHGLFSGKEKEIALVGESSSDALNENAKMNDEEVRSSLIKFIQAFYTDQKKGYFDPPSYFSPITQTYYNFHNLTYKRLKEIHYKRLSDMQNLDINWVVSTLDYERDGSNLVATYWAKLSYTKPSVRKVVSANVKHEMIINAEGKIVSLREIEIANYEAYDLVPLQDTADGEPTYYQNPAPTTDNPGTSAPVSNPEALYEGRLYDLGSVDAAPEFPGGQRALARFLGSQIRYPALARENNVQGKVYISFIVEKNGTLTDFKVIRGIGSGCDEEAVRVLKGSPAWKPGMVDGKPVRTSYVQPITYQLAN